MSPVECDLCRDFAAWEVTEQAVHDSAPPCLLYASRSARKNPFDNLRADSARRLAHGRYLWLQHRMEQHDVPPHTPPRQPTRWAEQHYGKDATAVIPVDDLGPLNPHN